MCFQVCCPENGYAPHDVFSVIDREMDPWSFATGRFQGLTITERSFIIDNTEAIMGEVRIH